MFLCNLYVIFNNNTLNKCKLRSWEVHPILDVSEIGGQELRGLYMYNI